MPTKNTSKLKSMDSSSPKQVPCYSIVSTAYFLLKLLSFLTIPALTASFTMSFFQLISATLSPYPSTLFQLLSPLISSTFPSFPFPQPTLYTVPYNTLHLLSTLCLVSFSCTPSHQSFYPKCSPISKIMKPISPLSTATRFVSLPYNHHIQIKYLFSCEPTTNHHYLLYTLIFLRKLFHFSSFSIYMHACVCGV